MGGLVLSRGPERLRFFSEGWGGAAQLRSLGLPQEPPSPIEIEWGPPRFSGALSVRDGTFLSPVAALPAVTRDAQVRRIAPAAGADRICLLMAAWNDHGYETRTRLARQLAGRGIASLLLLQPYYGPRRPHPDVHQPIATVADFALMGHAALEEGRALLGWAGERRYQPGVSGYSMGGNMAALISATVASPVATAPLAASHSPAPVYLDGVLRAGIAWEALGGENAAAPRLRDLLLMASALRVPPAPHTAHAVIVGARHDAYVPRSATEDLHHHWPGSELRWHGGGHATLLWLRMHRLADAVADSFARTFPVRRS